MNEYMIIDPPQDKSIHYEIKKKAKLQIQISLRIRT
jgi:hypothetical protein